MKSDVRHFAFAVLALLAAAGCAPRRITVRVSPDGPIATPEAARDTLRRIRAERGGALPEGGAAVIFADGVYRLAAPLELEGADSGRPGRTVEWKAEHPGKAVFTGARAPTGWRTVQEADVGAALLPRAVRDKVLVADVPGIAPIPDFGGGSEEFYARRLNYPFWLYQGGKRLPCARYPDAPPSPEREGEGYVFTGRTVGGATHNDVSLGMRSTSGVFEFDSPKLAAWAREPDLWAYGLFLHEYADMKMAVTNVGLAAKTLALDNRWYPRGFKKGAPFHVFNAFSELDKPGEWALDRANRKVYLYPPENVASAPPAFGVAYDLVCATNLRHTVFSGLAFECPRRDAMRFTGCSDVTVAGCWFRLTGAWGVRVAGGARVRLKGCAFAHLGEGGVCLSGGDRDALTPAAHAVAGCDIGYYGESIPSYRPGVMLWGVGNLCISNRIHHTRHQGVWFNGNDHRIAFNEIRDTCLYNDDAGAVYCCQRDWTKRGTVIEGNLIEGTGKRPYPTGNDAIYLDDFSSGNVVLGNRVDGGTLGVHIGGGNGNTVVSNEIRNCEKAILIGSRRSAHFGGPHEMGTHSPLFAPLLAQRGKYLSEPWVSRYPDLARLVAFPDTYRVHDPIFNRVEGNLFFRSGPFECALMNDVAAYCSVKDNALVEPEKRPLPPAIVRIDVFVAALPEGAQAIAEDMLGCELLASQKGRRVYAKIENAREAWKDYSFAFTAACGGTVSFSLSGGFGEDTEYADVRVSGHPAPFSGARTANHNRQAATPVVLKKGERVEVTFKARAACRKE